MSDALRTFLERPSATVAPLLLGCIIERQIDGVKIRVRIVEVEAYDESDAASHSYKGQTPRTDVMFGEPGHLYVYFTYGMHYCCNIVTGKKGTGAAILIRAVEPLEGIEHMQRFRNKTGIELTNGPAKLCQALAIDARMSGHDLTQVPMKLILQPAVDPSEVSQTTRIGISQAKEVPWRFYLTGNPYVSR